MNAPRAMAPQRLLVCFSHLPWDLVFQRPHHLLVRAARDSAVLYVEEPREADVRAPRLNRRLVQGAIEVLTPLLPRGLPDSAEAVRRLVEEAVARRPSSELIAWYYTPMALDYSGGLRADVVVYDCMDELAAFQNPPHGLVERENRLFDIADLVFTGGHSLYTAKRHRHPRVYCFPSSIDVQHFRPARAKPADPTDQASVPHPRIGFFGVIDERMDREFVTQAASDCPEIQFVMLGPVVKIDPSSLPQAPNLHWLGPKTYAELPAYLGNWEAGWMPFALNEATRFISPTKTPEFLAAGLPVTSTAIADVVRDYGVTGLASIADADTIAETLRASLAPPDPAWHRRVEAHLARTSWDSTWSEMTHHLDLLLSERTPHERKEA